jgi:mannose-6-phosphate isomerase
MHLLEACLAWLPFDRTGIYRRIADELVTLLETAFVDPKSGAIFEYFDDSLRLSNDKSNEFVEPGHLFEWFWLLKSYTQATDQPTMISNKIYEFAHLHGKNRANGLLYGEVSSSGLARDRSVRLWPHAEWTRAELMRLQGMPDDNYSRLGKALSALWRFLETPLRGLWFERFDHISYQFKNEPSPASSLYHIVGAFSALIDASKSSTRSFPSPSSGLAVIHPTASAADTPPTRKRIERSL